MLYHVDKVWELGILVQLSHATNALCENGKQLDTAQGKTANKGVSGVSGVSGNGVFSVA